MGGNGHFIEGASRAVEVYDPANNTWDTKASMPHPRVLFEANVVNGKIYVMGGKTDGGQYSTVTLNEVYDPAHWRMDY